MTALYIIILALLSAIAYRAGGVGGKYFKTWMRDWIIPLIQIIAIGIIFALKLKFWWVYLLVYILTGFALTTYYDSLFGGKDNFYMAGAGIGLSYFPLIFAGLNWYAILGRAIFLALSFGLINKYVNKWQIPNSDNVEEYSRGFLIIISLFIFII